MMRIAVAGTNALALLVAHFLKQETSHQLVILSRSVGNVSEVERGYKSSRNLVFPLSLQQIVYA